MSYDFQTKNARRQKAKAENPGNFRQGRLNRRAFAWKGAFGNEVSRVYNDCALGTSAPPRLVKNDDRGGDWDLSGDHDERL